MGPRLQIFHVHILVIVNVRLVWSVCVPISSSFGASGRLCFGNVAFLPVCKVPKSLILLLVGYRLVDIILPLLQTKDLSRGLHQFCVVLLICLLFGKFSLEMVDL